MKVFLIAGELSGDALGGALMSGLTSLRSDIQFAGIGGPQMQAHGLSNQFDMAELSLMGLVEILPKYFHLKRRIAETAQAVRDFNPDVLITIDSPDFCLRVAKLVKAQTTTPIVHYVAPSVWAWRPKRAVKMAKVVDHVLAILPFEPPLMQAHGMRCDFVGHPITQQALPTPQEVAAFKSALPGHGPILTVLPGSRKSEVTRLAPVFTAALNLVKEARPDLQVVIPAAAPVVDLVKELMPLQATLLDGRENDATSRKWQAFCASDAALAASGTVSLELAAAGTPMVIAYDMAWLSRMVISRMLLIDTVTLVNLVSETRVVPEFIGADCKPERVAQGLLRTLDDPTTQTQAMNVTMQRFGKDGEAPGLRAAKAVLDGLSLS